MIYLLRDMNNIFGWLGVHLEYINGSAQNLRELLDSVYIFMNFHAAFTKMYFRQLHITMIYKCTGS